MYRIGYIYISARSSLAIVMIKRKLTTPALTINVN